MGRLDGKQALVTGGASGIGEAIARLLAREGASLTLLDLDESKGSAVAGELGAHLVTGHVGDAHVWDTLTQTLGRLDIACLNAGVATGSTLIEELPDDAYRRAVATNVDGVVFGVRALAPLMRSNGGSIAVTASLAGIVPLADDPIYTLTKHAVVGFVRSVSDQLRRDGITINAICPGMTDTPLLDAGQRSRFAAAEFPLIAPEDVAAAALDACLGSESGQAFVCQPGREPVRFRFPNAPGPRTPGAAGRRPPSAADDLSAPAHPQP